MEDTSMIVSEVFVSPEALNVLPTSIAPCYLKLVTYFKVGLSISNVLVAAERSSRRNFMAADLL